MNNLLDTHTFIWFNEGDIQLSKDARKAIERDDVINFISIASLWEISIKISLGKLELKTPFSSISDQIFKNGFRILPITFEDTLTLSKLPFHHRDPFDRMMISQGISNKLVIISKDKIFNDYEVSLIW
jgi:PIN domain nuclease of toxin-antitoxin system